MSTPTRDITHPDTDSTSETTDTPPPKRHTGTRIAVGVLAVAALLGGGYAVGATVHSDGESGVSGKPAPYSAAVDQDSGGSGYGQGAAAAASAGADVGLFVLSAAVPMGGRIVDALPADKRTHSNHNVVAATALPAGHVLDDSDVAEQVRGGLVFSVAVRADQYPAVTALRYGTPVVIVGAAANGDFYSGQLLGVRPTEGGSAVLTMTTNSGRQAAADTQARADTIRIMSQS